MSPVQGLRPLGAGGLGAMALVVKALGGFVVEDGSTMTVLVIQLVMTPVGLRPTGS